MKRTPHKTDVSPEELALMAARAEDAAAAAGMDSDEVDSTGDADSVEEDSRAVQASSDFANDPAFASLADVQLPAGMVSDGEDDEEDLEDADAEATDAAIASTNVYYENPEDDPYFTGPAADDEEEDEDDYVARGTDAFLVAARTEEDVSSLEVFCYNEAEGSLYVHHDITLSAFPLALAWMDCAPVANVSKEEAMAGAAAPAVQTDPASAPVGSFIGVGTFQPGIEIWNLDVLNPLEPVVTLGGMEDMPAAPAATSRRRKKKGQRLRPKLRPGSHSDAVLSLGWNKAHRQLLASGSADKTVKLWDVLTGSVVNTYNHHVDKVQAVAWHLQEPTVLATGAFDGTLAVLDARNPSAGVARMAMPADVEKIQWCPHAPAHLYASDESGTVRAWDVRQPAKPMWTLKAHTGACTSLSFAPRVRGLLATAGADKCVKLWDVDGTVSATGGAVPGPSLLQSKAMDGGELYAAGMYGYSPWLMACAGSADKMIIWDIASDSPAVPTRVGDSRVQAVADVPSLAIRVRDDAQAAEPTALEVQHGAAVAAAGTAALTAAAQAAAQAEAAAAALGTASSKNRRRRKGQH